MKARQCQRCGAPLPEAAVHESVTCEFCGMAYDPTSAFKPSVHVKLAAGTGKRLLLIILGALFIPILGVIAVTCAVAFTTMTAARRARPSRGVPAPRTSPALPGRMTKPVRPSELDPARGWQALDVAPPPGGAGSLDAVAAIPWALSLAQAWRQDARLERVDVDKLRPDGLVNARDDAAASVMYRFLSPALIEEQRRQADLGKSDVKAGLFIEVKQGEVRALVTSAQPRGEALPPHPASLPLKGVLDGIERTGKLPAKPFYSGYLIHLEREGWVWYLSTLSRRESIPRARASDGKPHPYR